MSSPKISDAENIFSIIYFEEMFSIQGATERSCVLSVKTQLLVEGGLCTAILVH